GIQHLSPDYVRSRIAVNTSSPLNRERLLEALQLLQLNPLIENLSAELSAGSSPGASVLEVRVAEADSFNVQLVTDNLRSPSVGSFRRRFQLSEASILKPGDSLSFEYANTDGSNAIDASYALPLNPRDGTLSFNYGTTLSNVIEPPFDTLDIESDFRYYELTLRQPLIQTPEQEFALGLTASRRENDISSSLLESEGFPLSELSSGASEEGRTRISALRFFQEWTQRNRREVIAVRSQFSLGVGWLNATVNENPEPDSRFFAWRGQAQWVRLLARDTAFASAEVRLPIVRVSQAGVLQIAPFVDVGTTWNNSGRDAPEQNTLASIGLGLRFSSGDRFTARLDWGIPLVSVDSRDRTWQENGLYFSVRYNPS
ncbi:MAG: hemolysin activation/secretion protein, partial [Cyanobacteria bacterium SW_8_48_13]